MAKSDLAGLRGHPTLSQGRLNLQVLGLIRHGASLVGIYVRKLSGEGFLATIEI